MRWRRSPDSKVHGRGDSVHVTLFPRAGMIANVRPAVEMNSAFLGCVISSFEDRVITSTQVRRSMHCTRK